MKHRSMTRTSVALLALAAVVGAAAAQTPAQQQAKEREARAKALYAKYLPPPANYDTDAFLKEPWIRSELQAVAGKQLPKVLQNINVRGELDLVGGAFVMAGNAPHQGLIENGVVCAHPYGGVEAAIASKGRITVFTRATSYDGVMLCIKDWISGINAQFRDRMTQAKNVQIATAK